MKYLSLFALFAAILSTAFALKLKLKSGRTMSQIVQLLERMSEDSKSEGKQDGQTFQKYDCYCNENKASKSKDITYAKDRIPAVEAQIASWKATISRLSEELGALHRDMLSNEESRAQAKAIREKENAAFIAEEAELKSGITALDEAVALLTSVSADETSAGAKTTLLATMQPGQLKKIIGKVGVFLSSEQHAKLTRILAAPHLETYKPGSSEIVGILKQMADTFKENLAESVATENKKQTGFAEWLAAKQAEYDAMSAASTTKNALLASRDESVTTEQQELDALKNTLAADMSFLSELTAECDKQKGLFQNRQVIRQKEQSAIAEAISILNSDAAFESFGNTLSDVSLPTLVQRRVFLRQSKAHKANTMYRSQALSQLTTAGLMLHSARLSALARAASGDQFADLKGMINKLKDVLDAEQETDDNAKEWCTNENDKNAKSHTELESSIVALHTAITALAQDIAAANAAHDHAAASLETSLAARADATKQRDSQHAIFEKTLADMHQSSGLLDEALVVLGKFYDWLGRKEGPHHYDFHTGVDSGGSNLERIPGASVEQLEEACSNNPECVGFNTNGWLKSALQPTEQWYSWGNGAEDGLYVKVFDKDPAPALIQLQMREAPTGFAGNYAAQTESGNKVISLLQFIKQEVQAEASAAIAAEDEAVRVFTDLVGQMDAQDAGYRQEMADQQRAAADKTEEQVLKKQDLDKTEKDLSTLAKYMEDLAPHCGFVLDNHEERKTLRTQEKEALVNGITILEGLETKNALQ